MLSKVFTFFSATGNIGTTTTVLSIADSIATITDAKVGVLFLNAWDDGSDYFESVKTSLDQLKSRLTGKQLHDNEDFLNKFISFKNNMYVLTGNKDRRLERLFTNEEAEYLIKRATEVFDIVLIDAGCHFDNALSATAIFQADERFLVLNQQSKAMKRFEQIFYNTLHPLHISKEDIQLIVTNYRHEPYLPTDTDISKQLDVPLLATIDHVDNGWIAEIEASWTPLLKNTRNQKAVESIAKYIASISEINFTEKDKKREFFKFLKTGAVSNG